MTLWDFYKRRLIRLHPMVIAGTLIGVFYIFFSEYDLMENIQKPDPIVFFGSILMSLLMIPTPRNFDIRGLHESNGINGTFWTLHYEYLSNILYSIIIRRLNTVIIAIITILSSFLTINLTMNFDIFGVLIDRDDRKYTVIGGWEISSCELYIGFARLLYPFFCGYLISRLKISINYHYWSWRY
jgi:peptidoglycan/LPS O-acetylase OafA/YrhL